MDIKNPEKAIQPLESLGFKYKGEYNIPMRRYFNRPEGVDTNLHVVEMLFEDPTGEPPSPQDVAIRKKL